MNVVDTDRINFIKESGYQDINLFKMKPMTCTPKNNMIIAKKYNS